MEAQSLAQPDQPGPASAEISAPSAICGFGFIVGRRRRAYRTRTSRGCGHRRGGPDRVESRKVGLRHEAQKARMAVREAPDDSVGRAIAPEAAENIRRRITAGLSCVSEAAAGSCAPSPRP